MKPGQSVPSFLHSTTNTHCEGARTHRQRERCGQTSKHTEREGAQGEAKTLTDKSREIHTAPTTTQRGEGGENPQVLTQAQWHSPGNAATGKRVQLHTQAPTHSNNAHTHSNTNTNSAGRCWEESDDTLFWGHCFSLPRCRCVGVKLHFQVDRRNKSPSFLGRTATPVREDVPLGKRVPFLANEEVPQIPLEDSCGGGG